MTMTLMSYGTGVLLCANSPFAAGVVEGAPKARRLVKYRLKEGRHEHLRIAGRRAQILH
ncbi:hypothetical protein [Indioceanicola profundi]|uniref:hypothetical protein n=1 Tax=Indioceanicola profundi TaxID=2220096 RepID=UPI0013C4D7CE|nr:hypothetical protein [Indioceanicola profundi]